MDGWLLLLPLLYHVYRFFYSPASLLLKNKRYFPSSILKSKYFVACVSRTTNISVKILFGIKSNNLQYVTIDVKSPIQGVSSLVTSYIFATSSANEIDEAPARVLFRKNFESGKKKLKKIERH